MKLIRTVDEMHRAQHLPAFSPARGFVPTMGYLHEGHLALIRTARRHADEVVVSIFVNPTQFGAGEDLERYPRDENHDLDLCRAEGVDIVFAPPIEEMYPDPCEVTIQEARWSRELCGRSRSGHFAGVLTVVAKLLNIVQPGVAVFGQKDAQQFLVIRKMVQALNFPICLMVAPTVREPDGLAMSSRNTYLDAPLRQDALALYLALRDAQTALAEGMRNGLELQARLRAGFAARCPCGQLHYLELRDPRTFRAVQKVDAPTLFAIAAQLQSVRLIDNMVLDEQGRERSLQDVC